MHFPHLLNFVKVDNEAALVCVILLDALATEHRPMVRAIEMLYTLLVSLAYQAIDAFLVLEIYVTEYRVAFD